VLAVTAGIPPRSDAANYTDNADFFEREQVNPEKFFQDSPWRGRFRGFLTREWGVDCRENSGCDDTVGPLSRNIPLIAEQKTPCFGCI
jgi:hypothetical protein